jgi:MFS family permease
MRSGNASVFAVGAVMVLLGVVGAMETPNGTACVPLLVAQDRLESANGVIQAVQSLSGIIAPILGGVLYGAIGIVALVAIRGASFGLAALMEMFIRIPFVKRPHTGGMAATIANDLKDGFRYVWNEPLIRNLAGLAALLNLVVSPCIIVAAPLVLRTTMKAGDAVYGAGMGMIQFASILGALTVGVFSKHMRMNTLWRWIAMLALMFIPAAASVAPMAFRLGFWPPLIVFMLSMVFMSATATIISIYVVVRVQSKTPDENLGKVMAIIMAVAQCAAPLGQFLYGVAFESFRAAEYLPLMIACGASVIIAFFGKTILINEE